MASETHSIKVTAEMTVDELLDAADESPIWIERNGVIYSVVRRRQADDEDIWRDYDPQAVIEMLDELERNPLRIDAEQWIADVYRWREEGSRPEDRS